MEVPVFNTYYPSESVMDKYQKQFYRKLESKLNNKEYLDIEGNISYVFVYLYKLLSNWNKKGFDYLSDLLIFISEIYKHENKLSDYCLFWAYDCLLGLKKYEEFLDKTEPKEIFGTSTNSSNTRLNIQYKIGVDANPIDILLTFGGRKTKFITSNEALYKDKIKLVFNKYSNDNINWFESFEKSGCMNSNYEHQLFCGSVLDQRAYLDFRIYSFYSAQNYTEIIKELSKEAENIARKEIGVPLIGEGWISETSLFRKLESEFKQTKVIQHGQPTWLGKQHFDIWFPHWNIAVEYHGKQHFEPVEFFGGKEAFEKTLERDKRKIYLAKKYGVTLFVIKEDDDQDKLVEIIKSIHKI